MRIFNNYKKTIRALSVFGLFLFVLILAPKKAQATVPVYDEQVQSAVQSLEQTLVDQVQDYIMPSLTSIQTGIYAQVLETIGPIENIVDPSIMQDVFNEERGFALDPTPQSMDGWIFELTKQDLDQKLSDTIDWTNGSFNGNPEYPTNTEDWSTYTALNSSGVYLDNYSEGPYETMCAPWRRPVYFALRDQRKDLADLDNLSQYPVCTLDQTIDTAGEMGAYLDDFTLGGFDAWDSIMSGRDNDPMSFYLDTMVTMTTKEKVSREKANTEFQAGNGFITLAGCDDFSGAPGSELFCQQLNVVSPGEWQGTQVGGWSVNDQTTVTAADSNDETLGGNTVESMDALQSTLRGWAP